MLKNLQNLHSWRRTKKRKIHASALKRSALRQDIILVARFMLERLKHEHTNNKIVIVEKRGLRIKLITKH